MATNSPLTITPSSNAPSAAKALALPPRIQRDDEGDDRRQHRQQRGNDHFLDRRLRQHVDGAAIIGPVRARHDAGLLLELAAHFLDHRARRAAHRRHGDAAEEIGNEAAKDEARDDVRIGEVEIDLADALEERHVGVDEMLQIVRVGGEQHQRAEARRTDGVALGHGLGGVADGVERVGVADALPSAVPPFRRCRRRCRSPGRRRRAPRSCRRGRASSSPRSPCRRARRAHR